MAQLHVVSKSRTDGKNLAATAKSSADIPAARNRLDPAGKGLGSAKRGPSSCSQPSPVSKPPAWAVAYALGDMSRSAEKDGVTAHGDHRSASTSSFFARIHGRGRGRAAVGGAAKFGCRRGRTGSSSTPTGKGVLDQRPGSRWSGGGGGAITLSVVATVDEIGRTCSTNGNTGNANAHAQGDMKKGALLEMWSREPVHGTVLLVNTRSRHSRRGLKGVEGNSSPSNAPEPDPVRGSPRPERPVLGCQLPPRIGGWRDGFLKNRFS